MKAKELMIGDWVQVPSLIDNVEHYDAWCKVKQLRDCDLDVVGFKELKYSEIIPIPLTPENLEKIGFVKYIAGQYVLPKMVGEILVSIMPMKGLPNANAEWLVAIKNGYTDVRIPITYIHELQHVLKTCGIKKEIEL